MSLKPTTQKLLAFLFDSESNFYGNYHHLRYLLPHLTDAGRRSLVSYAFSQAWIEKERVGVETRFRLTSHGQQALSQKIAFLTKEMIDWQGEWSLVVFLSPPKHDRQFRYLRLLLTDLGVAALTRGVYLLPGQGNSRLKSELYASYRQSVCVFNLSEWNFGDERSLISEKYQLVELLESYSGVSKQIDQLLKTKKAFSSLNDQSKKEIFSVFNRLYSLIQKDIGICEYYFPQVASPTELLAKLHSLVL